MEKLLPILVVLILGTAGWAQVTHQDYQAWRRAERSPYASLDEAGPLTADATYHLWRAAEQASYRARADAEYHAWRRSEQASYRLLVARDRSPVLAIVDP